MKKLYFVRHGLTKDNANAIWSGQRETKLTDQGVRQAIKRGKDIKTKNIKIDLIITSPLSRAIHSAELIAKEIGYPLDKIEINPQFIERSFGILEGTPDSNYYSSHSYQDMDMVENAESLEDLQLRAQKAFSYLQAIKHDNILVVGHGTFGRALKRAINGHPYTHEYTHQVIRIDNAELVELI